MRQPGSGPGEPGAGGSKAGAGTNGEARPRSRGGEPRFLARRAGALVRAHWLAMALLGLGLLLRVAAGIAYRPAIIYIDSLKYITGAWPGSDPIAYKVPLKLILAVGDLSAVAAVQHLLGLAMAAAIYALLVRRGAPRWLGALAMAPVLFDAYQVQAEQMIMPDVWFQALIVAGFAALLIRPVPGTALIMAAGLAFGLSAGVRQIGEILIVPLLLFLATLGGGWRQFAWRSLAGGLAFGVAVMAYLAGSGITTGRYYLSKSSSSLTYGRMAAAANCATLRLPAAARPLCPSRAQQAMGPDWLDHDSDGPLKQYQARYLRQKSPAGSFLALEGRFNRAVETQQPWRVAAAILFDATKLFAINRHTSQGDPPIWRWQFQGTFPTYEPYVMIRDGRLIFNYARAFSPTGDPLPPRPVAMSPALGGAPRVSPAIASFLRGYQLGGGYTPGPLLLVSVLAGLAGSLLLARRRRLTPGTRALAQAAVLTLGTGVLVLGASDVFEFSWRYQLPAVVTLPVAGALGAGAVIAMVRSARRGGLPELDPAPVPQYVRQKL